MEHIRYKKETEVVTFQGKEITLETSPRCSRRNRKWPNAGNWSSGFMSCSANMPISGRKRKPGRKVFRSHR